MGLAGLLKLNELDLGTDRGQWVTLGGGSRFENTCPDWEAAAFRAGAVGTHGEMWQPGSRKVLAGPWQAGDARSGIKYLSLHFASLNRPEAVVPLSLGKNKL